MKSVALQFENKVLVLGLAKSGEAAARLLAKLGAIVYTVNDRKPFEENPSAQALAREGSRLSVADILLNFWMKILELMVEKSWEFVMTINGSSVHLKRAFLFED